MLVTITTDASFYPEHKEGGYAFWISTNLGRIRLAAAFKNKVICPHDAEFKCIINSLHRLHKENLTIKTIYINTDSQTVIDTVDKKNTSLPSYAKENLKQFNLIIGKLNSPKIIMRHVKGHLHTKTPRHWVNSWCDKEAKKAARKKIFGSLVK